MEKSLKGNIKEKIRGNIKVNNDYKFLKIAMGIFLLSPLVFLAYISSMAGGDIAGALAKNTMLNVTFIAAMASGFSALVCKGIYKDLKEGKAIETAKVQLILMLIAQVVLFNFIGIALILVSLITSFDWKKNKLKSLFRNFKEEKVYGKLIGASMILGLAFLCLFITGKIGAIV